MTGEAEIWYDGDQRVRKGIMTGMIMWQKQFTQIPEHAKIKFPEKCKRAEEKNPDCPTKFKYLIWSEIIIQFHNPHFFSP